MEFAGGPRLHSAHRIVGFIRDLDLRGIDCLSNPSWRSYHGRVAGNSGSPGGPVRCRRAGRGHGGGIDRFWPGVAHRARCGRASRAVWSFGRFMVPQYCSDLACDRIGRHSRASQKRVSGAAECSRTFECYTDIDPLSGREFLLSYRISRRDADCGIYRSRPVSLLRQFGGFARVICIFPHRGSDDPDPGINGKIQIGPGRKPDRWWIADRLCRLCVGLARLWLVGCSIGAGAAGSFAGACFAVGFRCRLTHRQRARCRPGRDRSDASSGLFGRPIACVLSLFDWALPAARRRFSNSLAVRPGSDRPSAQTPVGSYLVHRHLASS